MFVLGPCGRGQASWFLHGRAFGTVRRRLFFVPYQFKAGRSRVFETLLEMIFFFVVMITSFSKAHSMFDPEAVKHMFLHGASVETDFVGNVGSHCC